MNKTYNFKKIDKGQLQYYLDRMLQGDIEARNKLIYHYSANLVEMIKEKYNDTNYPKEDLIQAGMLGILKAFNSNPTTDSNYLSRKVIHYVNLELKRVTTLYNHTDNIELEVKPTLEECIIDNENIDLIYDAFKELKDSRKEVLYLYFYKNYTLKQIAEKYNISHQGAHHLLKKSIYFIKQHILLNSIDFNNKYSVIKNIDNLFKLYNLNKKIDNNEKIDLFFNYIKNLNEKEIKIMCLYFYNNISIKELVNIYTKEEDEIIELLNNFIDFVKEKTSNKENDKVEFNKKYNDLSLFLYKELKIYSLEDIKLAIMKTENQNKGFLEKALKKESFKFKKTIYDSTLASIRRNIRQNYLSMYNYFEMYSLKEIDNVLNLLDDNDKCKIKLFFYEDGKNKQVLFPEIFNILRNMKSTLKKFHLIQAKESTIFDYLKNYSKEDIMNEIINLNIDEIALIKERYGNDLNKPTKSKDIELNKKVYYILNSIDKKLEKQKDNNIKIVKIKN